MSDFDREAEREKLREQFERDKQKRETSERMSELLLQGATMTNRHCPECHSPVFRYDGREFCPTCQREVAVEGGADAEAEAEVDADADADTGAEANANANADGESPTPDEEATPPSGGTDPQPDVSPRTGGEPLESPSTEPSEAESRVEPDANTSASEDSVPAPAQDRRPTTPGLPTTRDDDSLAEAEETLRRELVELTRGAEKTRDLSRKRTFLAAAREAAETLEAVRRL